MDATNFFFSHVFNKNGLAIAIYGSIGLLIIAANQSKPSLWLIVPAWIILGICIAICFLLIPYDSPYNEAFYPMIFVLIFGLNLWETAFHSLFQLIAQPSGKHLLDFLGNRAFLVLIIIYFILVCLHYGGKLRKCRESLKSCQQQCKENVEAMRKWRRLAEEANDRTS